MNPLFEKLLSLPSRGLKSFPAFHRFDAKLGSPHRAFRSVHVAGTNGKGSVTLKIATALEKEGFRVGLYTSPHISDFRERIRINGQMIPEEKVEELFAFLFSQMEEELSFFDVLTAVAFLYFKQERVDWGVIETGIGGRLDSTNVIMPEIAVITSISYDHTDILGTTLEEIAYEKGGIVKPGIPLVVGPSAAPFYPNATWVGKEAFYDLENQAVAREVLKKLKVSPKSITEALPVRPSCRFEVRGEYIFDVAHNPDGFFKLAQALRHHFPDEKFHFAVAFSKDKDWRACLEWIRPLALSITAIRIAHPKLLPPEKLGIERIAASLPDPVSGKVVICGSFYLMEQALRKIGK